MRGDAELPTGTVFTIAVNKFCRNFRFVLPTSSLEESGTFFCYSDSQLSHKNLFVTNKKFIVLILLVIVYQKIN